MCICIYNIFRYTTTSAAVWSVNWQFSFRKFVSPFVTEWSWFLKKTYNKYTESQQHNNRQKVGNVSACLCGDFRQGDGGSADIYKFSVLLLFCMDFRVGLFIVCCCYYLLFVFFFLLQAEHWMDIWFTIILLSNSFHQSSNSESTTKIWRWKVATWEWTRKKIERYSKVLCGVVCVRIINTKTSNKQNIN